LKGKLKMLVRSLVAFFLLCTVISWAGSKSEKALPKKMSAEETLVRTAYGKLSFAAQLNILDGSLIKRYPDSPDINDSLAMSKFMNDQIKFDLTDFRVGNLSEIGDQDWTTLISGSIDVIQVQTVGSGISFQTPYGGKKDHPMLIAAAKWKSQDGPPVEELAKEHRIPKIKEVLSQMRKSNSGSPWTRYASFNVLAILQERTVSYRAVFFFSRDEVLPLDYALGMGVAPFIHERMYPFALVESAYREVPFVQAWINGNQLRGCKQFKQPEVCCNANTGQCGIASEDLERSLDIRIEPDEREMVQRQIRQLRPTAKGGRQ
jgi:hypothetical protein